MTLHIGSTSDFYYHLKADKLPTSDAGRQSSHRTPGAMTIVAYSAMVHEALAVADELATEGTEVEVVDLRSVKPLDTDTVMASVARTGRLLCVGESWPGRSHGRSYRASLPKVLVCSTRFQRLNAKDTPVPYHPNLWSAHRPTARSIAAAARNVLRSSVCPRCPSSCRSLANRSPRRPSSMCW